MVQGLVFFGHGPVCSLVFTCRSIAMDDSSLDFDIPGRELAVAAEALYLANLMIVRDGGFPPLLLEPIDFGALYMQQAAANADDQSPAIAAEGNA